MREDLSVDGWKSTLYSMTPRPRFYAYVPSDKRPATGVPSASEDFWPWVVALREHRWSGAYYWTLQTCLRLRDAGFPCDLADTLPSDGIIIAHRDFLADTIRPSATQLLVCLLGDRETPEWWGIGRHPYAQLHVVQNPRDPSLMHPDELWESYHIPLWPQPGLLPRDPARGTRFQIAAFLGIDLAAELEAPTWRASLSELGLSWHRVPFERWHDYREIDVVVAVRSFDRREYAEKPASKLYNAWLAGVPAVLGREPAYRYVRRSELDYLEVESVQDALCAVRRLRDDAGLREAMMANCRERAPDVSPSRLVALWCQFLTDTATPAYERWHAATPLARRLFLVRRQLAMYRRSALVRRGRVLSYRFSRAALRCLRAGS